MQRPVGGAKHDTPTSASGLLVMAELFGVVVVVFVSHVVVVVVSVLQEQKKSQRYKLFT